MGETECLATGTNMRDLSAASTTQKRRKTSSATQKQRDDDFQIAASGSRRISRGGTFEARCSGVELLLMAKVPDCLF